MNCKKIILLVIIGCIFCGADQLGAQDWLQWGGPNGDFTVKATGLSNQWPSDGPKILWKRALGEGYSTILHKNGKLFTMYSEGGNEIVISLDAKTGKTIWEHSYPRKFWDDMILSFGEGPNASPLIFNDRIITIGIAGEMRCLDLNSGKLLWKHNLPSEYGRLKRMEEYGYSASPIRYKNMLIVHVGGDKHSLIAIKPEDGSIIWKGGPGSVSYAQASVIKLAGQDQFIYFSAEGVNGLDPLTGKLLWHHTIPIHNGNHKTPIVQCDEDHIFVSSSFENGGGRLLKISGNSEKMKATKLWFETDLRGSCWTLFRIGDHIYGSAGMYSYSKFTAFEWRTGKILWQERGYTMAQCLYADNKAIFLDQKGFLSMAKVSPEKFEILGNVKMTEQVSWTLPTLTGTKLYLRDRKTILALELEKSDE